MPPGYLILTAGVDTQDDRLAVQVVAWGLGEAAAVIDWLELPGSPGRQDVWQALTDYLNTPIINSFGNALTIEATAIDSGGHFTHEVYQYVRAGRIKRAMAIKGSKTPNRAILSRPSAQDVRASGKVIKRSVKLWPVGTDTAKHALYGRLKGDEGQPPEARRLRFSADLELDYYQQLTAEVFDPEKNRWLLRKGKRNEALDTFVYATAASHHPEVRVHVKRDSEWRRLARWLETPAEDAPPPAPQEPAPAAKPAVRRPPRRPLVR